MNKCVWLLLFVSGATAAQSPAQKSPQVRAPGQLQRSLLDQMDDAEADMVVQKLHTPCLGPKHVAQTCMVASGGKVNVRWFRCENKKWHSLDEDGMRDGPSELRSSCPKESFCEIMLPETRVYGMLEDIPVSDRLQGKDLSLSGVDPFAKNGDEQLVRFFKNGVERDHIRRCGDGVPKGMFDGNTDGKGSIDATRVNH